MHQAGRLAGFALFAALVLEGSTFAQEGLSTEVHLSPIGDSGVSGDATLKDVNGGMEVTLNVQGLPKPGVKHINHIHAGGTCADVEAGRMPPVTIPLKTITAQKDGTGSATTFVRGVSLGKIFGQYKKRLIIVHAKAKQGGSVVPPGITCANLAPLPDTGGPPPTAMLLVGAILVLGIAAGLIRAAPLRRFLAP